MLNDIDSTLEYVLFLFLCKVKSTHREGQPSPWPFPLVPEVHLARAEVGKECMSAVMGPCVRNFSSKQNI